MAVGRRVGPRDGYAWFSPIDLTPRKKDDILDSDGRLAKFPMSMTKIQVGDCVRLVPGRVARIVFALLARAERIANAPSGRISINWRGQSVQAEMSEQFDVPSLPE